MYFFVFRKSCLLWAFPKRVQNGLTWHWYHQTKVILIVLLQPAFSWICMRNLKHTGYFCWIRSIKMPFPLADFLWGGCIIVLGWNFQNFLLNLHWFLLMLLTVAMLLLRFVLDPVFLGRQTRLVFLPHALEISLLKRTVGIIRNKYLIHFTWQACNCLVAWKWEKKNQQNLIWSFGFLTQNNEESYVVSFH